MGLVTAVVRIVAVMVVALLLLLLRLPTVRVALIDVRELLLFNRRLDVSLVNAAVRFRQVNGLAPFLFQPSIGCHQSKENNEAAKNNLPVVRPVKFTVGRQGGVGRSFAAHPSAKDEADDEADEAKDQHEHSQVPGTTKKFDFSF